MKTKRRKITSETISIQGIETSRFARKASRTILKKLRNQCHSLGKVLPYSMKYSSKVVKAVRGKLTGRTKGAFGGMKNRKDAACF